MADVKPVRLQLSRKKGFRLVSPNGLPIVVVSRPSKWGNPFSTTEIVPEALKGYLRFPGEPPADLRGLTHLRIIGVDRVVQTYAWWIIEQPELMLALPELRGHDLACWCPLDQPCHADILLELAGPKEISR